MPLSTFRRGLFMAALLAPQLVHADPLNNGALGALAVIVLLVLGLSGFIVLLTGWAYLRPASQALYWGQLGLLLVSLWVGWWWASAPGADWPLLGHFNPLLQVCVPVGLWLNGLRWARSARSPVAQLLWTSVAVLALRYLLLLIPGALVESYYQHRYTYEQGLAGSPLPQYGYQFLTLVLGLGSWWVVLRQAAPALRMLLTRLWWRAPAATAGVSFAYYWCQLAFSLGRHSPSLLLSIPWLPTLQAGLLMAIVNFAVGLVAVRVFRPKPAA